MTAVLLFCFTTLIAKGQGDAIRPQVWNNFSVGWNVIENFSLRSNIAYNVLLSNEIPWSEFTFSTSAVFKFHRFMEASAGLYLSLADQTEDINSYEYRPYIGYRIFTNSAKRWNVSNLSRIEIRLLRYSNRTGDHTIRFRNRTDAMVSLNKRTMVENKNLFLYSYFEMFYNFGEEVQERFFDLFKYKIGFGYRLSYNWRFDFGFVFQDSRNTVMQPVILPTNIITNYIFEWGLIYVIPPKNTN